LIHIVVANAAFIAAADMVMLISHRCLLRTFFQPWQCLYSYSIDNTKY